MLINLLTDADPDQELKSLDFDSPYLEQLRAFTEQGDYGAIAELCEQLAGEGIFDIRMVLGGLYGEVRVDPLGRLGEGFQFLTLLFGDAWHLIGPEERKSIYAKGSLAWLIKQILVDIETHQLDKTATWKSWIDGGLFREDIARTLADMEKLKAVLASAIADESQPSLLALNDLSGWLKGFQQQLPSVETEDTDLESSESEEQVQAPANRNSTPAYSGVQGSYHLDILLQKMALFRQLAEEGDVLKAAIIAADVNAILEQFDPKKYFPQLFSDYLYAMVNRSNQIAEAMEMRDTPQWMVLSELYLIDMQKFSEIEVE